MIIIHPIKEEFDIQEHVDLTYKKRDRLSIHQDHLKLEDMINLDKISVIRPDNIVQLYRERKHTPVPALPTSNRPPRNPNLGEPSPAAPPHPTRKTRRQLPWDPLKNPRRNTHLQAGTYDLPRVTDADLTKAHSGYIFESVRKIKKRKIKGQLSSIVHDNIVIEFKFEMVGVPRKLMRIVQMNYTSTFHQVHMAICDMCGWAVS